MSNPQHISTQEAARELHVSPRTVVRLIRAGELQARKKSPAANSPYLIVAESVQAFEIRQTKAERADGN